MTDKKGFVIILVVSFLTTLILTALVIMNLGCGDLLNTRAAGDITSAYYVAISGAEKMYGGLKAMENQTVTWPQAVSSANSEVRTRVTGGTLIGTFSATADTAGAGVFGVVSTGTVNGRTARVAVRYGFTSTFTNGYPIGSIGNMSLSGRRWWVLRSWVRAEGPLASGGTISTNSYVQVNGSLLQNQPFAVPSFWKTYDLNSGSWSAKETYDTNGDGNFVTDTTGKGYVNTADCGGDPAREATYAADNIDGNDRIDDRDAFIAYYTVELNKLGLNIGQGQTRYYNGDQDFSPSSVPAGTPIIFVNGDVNILFNDSSWWGSASDHTIVATGDITIVQPTNGNNDTLTLVAWGDVNTGGIRAFGGILGDLTVYANQNFNAYFGGRTDGTIFAKENVNIDTVLPIPGLLNRDLNRSNADWSDPANWPLGLPPDFNKISIAFRIRNERTQYVPIWQRE